MIAAVERQVIGLLNHGAFPFWAFGMAGMPMHLQALFEKQRLLSLVTSRRICFADLYDQMCSYFARESDSVVASVE